MPVVLDRPAARDRDPFLAAVAASRELHHPWVEPPATPEAWDRYVRRTLDPRFEAFLLRDAATGDPAGIVNVSEIVRGCFQSAYLGYYVLVPYQGRGTMTAGLRLVVREAFTTLGLHRLEANIQPGNVQSIALVARCGFRREGYSPRYLRVGGEWCDHERWAILSDDPPGASSADR